MDIKTQRDFIDAFLDITEDEDDNNREDRYHELMAAAAGAPRLDRTVLKRISRLHEEEQDAPLFWYAAALIDRRRFPQARRVALAMDEFEERLRVMADIATVSHARRDIATVRNMLGVIAESNPSRAAEGFAHFFLKTRDDNDLAHARRVAAEIAKGLTHLDVLNTIAVCSGHLEDLMNACAAFNNAVATAGRESDHEERYLLPLLTTLRHWPDRSESLRAIRSIKTICCRQSALRDIRNSWTGRQAVGNTH